MWMDFRHIFWNSFAKNNKWRKHFLGEMGQKLVKFADE